VKALISRTNETKYVQNSCTNGTGLSTLTNFVAFTSGITSVNEIYFAIPAVAQGLDNFERIGDKIQPKAIYVDMNVVVKNGPSDAFSTDKIVHIFLMTSKAVKDLNNYSAIPIGQMLDYGNGTSGGFDGTTTTTLHPVQKKSFTVLKHWKKRMQAGYGHPIGSTGTQAGTTDSVITPVTSSFTTIRMKVPAPNSLNYALASSTYPENFAPFFVVGWVRADSAGSAAPSFANTYVQAKTSMYYKDA